MRPGRGDQTGPPGRPGRGPEGPSNPANNSLVRRLKIAAEQQQLPQQKPMQPADVDRRSDDIDLMYWRGSVPVPPRRGEWPEEDDQLLKIPTKQMEPVGEDSPQPIWVTGNLPGWNAPNFWAKPFEYTFTRCVPTWEEEYPIGIFTTPDMNMTIIRSVSYDVISGLDQFDLFEYKMYSSGHLKATWEDMTIDPASAAAAQRYVFSGDTIPLRLDWLVDRNKTCRFTIKARGLVDLAGASNHAPGDPINPNAHFRLNIQGYIATLRRDVDGGPRPDDLGHMEYMHLDEELQHEGMTRGAGYYPDILNR